MLQSPRSAVVGSRQKLPFDKFVEKCLERVNWSLMDERYVGPPKTTSMVDIPYIQPLRPNPPQPRGTDRSVRPPEVSETITVDASDGGNDGGSKSGSGSGGSSGSSGSSGSGGPVGPVGTNGPAASALKSMWHIYLNDDASGADAAGSDGSISGLPSFDRRQKDSFSFVRNILADRDFRMRIRSLLREPAFNKWSTEAVGSLNETLVHQLSDRTLRSLFFAYVYTVRFLAELPALEVQPNSDPSMGWELRVRCNDLLDHLQSFFPCRFTVNTKTMDIATAMTIWLEERMKRSVFVAPTGDSVDEVYGTAGTMSGKSDVDFGGVGGGFLGGIVGGIGGNDVSSRVDGGEDDFDDPPYESLDDFNQLMSMFSGSSVTVDTKKVNGETAEVVSTPESYLYCVHDVLSLSRSVREAIAYHCLVVHIFCDLDLSVTVYMLRLLLSFLFPGVENRTSVIVRGSSGSGKSQFFDMIREFYNCASNGIISTQALACGRNVINTEMMPIGENLLCQIDEPKRVDNETFKLSISLVPIPTRSFSNQIAQSIPVLAKLVFTVNNMFQIESDDGILERLHCVFRLSHKHYNLVNDQTDMTRYNSGASYNIAHQFTDRIFPRDVDRASFSRGMFHVLHHWSVDQTSRPDVSYTLADQMTSFVMRCEFTAKVNRLSVGSGSGAGSVDDFLCDHRKAVCGQAVRSTRYQGALNSVKLIHQTISNALASSSKGTITRIRFGLEKKRPALLSSLRLADWLVRRKCLTEVTQSNPVFSIARWRRATLESDFASLVSDSTRSEHVKRLYAFYTRCERMVALLLSDDVLAVLTASFAQKCRELRVSALTSTEHLFPRIVSEFDSEVRVDISTLPPTLDMHLLDLQMSIDSFVRFKRTFAVEYSSVPVSGDVLRKQLLAFVNEINTTIDDAKYRVKLKDFFDRFETEYGKLRYRRPDNNQVVSNLWSVKLRRMY